MGNYELLIKGITDVSFITQTADRFYEIKRIISKKSEKKRNYYLSINYYLYIK